MLKPVSRRANLTFSTQSWFRAIVFFEFYVEPLKFIYKLTDNVWPFYNIYKFYQWLYWSVGWDGCLWSGHWKKHPLGFRCHHGLKQSQDLLKWVLFWSRCNMYFGGSLNTVSQHPYFIYSIRAMQTNCSHKRWFKNVNRNLDSEFLWEFESQGLPVYIFFVQFLHLENVHLNFALCQSCLSVLFWGHLGLLVELSDCLWTNWPALSDKGIEGPFFCIDTRVIQ